MRWRRRSGNSKGFSMVELTVTMLLVGILAAIVIPKLLGPRVESKNTEAKTTLQTAFTSARGYMADTRDYGNLCADDVNANLCANKTSLHSLSQSVGDTELPDDATPSDSKGAPPGAIWMGNGETGADPIAGDANSGKTIVLCTLVEGGDTVYCIKDDNGKIKYAKKKGDNVTVASVGNDATLFSATTDLNGKAVAQSSADTGQGQVAVEEPPLNSTIPSLSGTARRDSTLTGSPGSWSGRPTPTYTYQWQRCDSQGANCSDIAGATSSAYTLVIADVGKRVRLTVTASNAVSSSGSAAAAASTDGVNATSEPSAVIADPVISNSAPLNQVAPALTGQTTVGSNIITDDGTWEGAPAPDFSYQWRRCDLTGSNCVVMTGITGSTYALTSADAAHTIRSRVTATNSEGSASQLSAARGPISQQPLNVVAPSVSGNVAAGNTVTVDVGSWSGYPDPTFTYQWKRCDTAGLSCQLLDGATGSDYSLTNADSGSTLRITVTASNVAGSSSATSAASSSVEGAPENTSAPVISGTTSLAQTLSASRGSWAGTPTPTYSYQWQRCDLNGANCQSITSANSSTYQLTRTDGGSDLKVRVTATNSNGTANAYSSATSAVKTIPLNTTRPAVSGSTEIGGQITSSSGSWDAYPAATYAYKWQRCNSAGASCADISSATSNTYTVQASDANSTVRSVVTATNSEGSVASESEVTSYVSRPPVNTSPPAISGTLRVGQTLTATSGAWSNNPDSYAYQWQRCYNGACSDITGATSGTYLLVDDDTAMNMRVLVIASNGSGSAQAYSDSSDPVARAPLNTAAPAITGIAAAGQTLTVDNGSWKAYPVPTYTYQWQRCDYSGSSCTDITNATSATYQLTSDDIGITVKAKVRASNSEGSSTAISAASDIVGSPPTSVTLPAVTGTNKVGFSLSSSAGTWAGYPTPTIQYQWRRCDGTGVSCTDINGATLASYTLASADAGKTIISRVTATNVSGSATADSAATDFVLQTPENNAAPAITGTAQVGSSLSASSGSWAAYPTATYAYQWQISADGSTGWTSATGTGSTTTGYSPVSAERGQFLRIKVTASNSAGSTAAYSDATSAIKQIPTNTALPTVTGTVQVGSTLTTSSGSWTAFPTPTYAYQWQISTDGSTGWASATGTGSTTTGYTPVSAERGQFLRIKVTASNSAGSTTEYSDATVAIKQTPENTSAPVITGTAQVGSSLTASSGSWIAYPSATYAYQWQISADGSTGWASATGSGNTTTGYTPVSAERGQFLRIKVTASNSAGSTAAYSDVTAAIKQIPTNTALPAISGSVQVGSTLTVSSGSWTAFPTPTYAYQWQLSADGSTGWSSATGTGNTTASYAIAAADAGKYLRVTITASNSAGSSSADSAVTGMVLDPPANSSAPTIVGAPQVGVVSTSTSGSWTGIPTPTYSYQWQVSSDGSTGWTSATGSGAATSSYTPASVDSGKYLRLKITASNLAGSATAYSAVSSAVLELPSNTVVPAVSGTVKVGLTVTASSGSWGGYPTPIYAYQWQTSADGSTGWTSATGTGNSTSSYTIPNTNSQPGLYLRVRVTATNAAGAVAASSSNSRIIGLFNTAVPALSGTAQVGQTLTSTSGDWSSSYPAPTYAYQWQTSANGTTGWASATGAGNAAASYTVATSDASKYLRMQVTATNTAGTDSVNSASSAQVTQLPVNNSAPAISGTARAGQALSGTSGSWDGYPAPTYDYQWQVSANGSTGWASAAGSGNTTASYTAAVADVSKYLRLKVTATNSVGSVAAYSAASSQVDQTPVNTALPAITGTVQVGQALTSSSGSWDGYPALSYSYQWQVSANGSTGWASATGSGNTTASYTAAAADAGKFLRSKVTATNTAGSDIAYSDATVAVKQTPSNTTLPAVSGTAQVGQSLTASSGSWDGYPAPTYDYQWQVSANGTTGWSSATGVGNTTASYAVPSADAGKYLRVNVTASNSAGSSSAASAATSMVTETPANTALPALSGTAEIATTVSSSSGIWTGTPTPSITYQWQSSDDDAAWSNIASATASSYAIPATSAWIGKYIRVRVTGTNSAGADTVSSSSRHITGLLMSSSPTVTGTAQSGEALTAVNGAWTSYPAATYAYQWQVSSDGTTGWASATGTGNATSSYTVAAADASKYLRIQVTASNGVSSNVIGTSAATSRVTQKPVNTSLPAISGTPGAGVTLAVSSGSWDGYPAPTYAYQWQRCSPAGASCVDISGATSSSYLLALADNGQTVRAVVTASNSVGPTAANSAVTAIIVMEPVNSALPTISGTARKGSTLTATNGSWSNSPSSYSYQWQRCSPAGASCVDISGATSSTYLLLTADVNHRLLAKVTAANAYGSNTASSTAYSNTLQAPENTSAPTISGTLAVGSTLTGSAGSWDALPTATYEYQWQRSANGSTGWSSITGATSSTYALQVADSSQYIRLLVAATNSEGSASAQSAVSAQIGQAPSNTAAPAVSGAATTGSTLTSTSGTWDGFPAPSYAYQWQSSADGSTGWADITSATSASYIIATAQASKYLRVKVTATNSSGSAAAYASSSAQVRQLPTLSAAPVLSGTAQVGQTLSVSAGSWDGFPAPSQSYQWQTSPSGAGSWTDLAGANSASYSLLTAQAGLYMRAVITSTNSVGSATAPSASSAVIVQDPANTSLPAVSGTATVGGSLTASSGAWNGYPVPTYAYQWQVSADGSTGWASATGTGNASSSYVPAAGDAGKYLRVQVVATNSVSSATANSAATSVVTQSPVNTVAPGISGTTQVAIPVVATSGTWTAYPAPSYAYQWQVSANGSSGWTSATGSGSTTSSYTPANADIGQYLRVQVTASNAAGSASAYSSSAAVNGPPVNVSLPAITGTASSGSILSVSSGSWSGYPAPTYAYQWQVSNDGSTSWTSAAGSGSATSSYTVTAGDAGKYLRAQVTATNAADTAAVNSAASSQITQLPVNSSVPAVSGTARDGQSLSGTSGSWDGYPAPTYAYQWQVSADGSSSWASATGTVSTTASYTVATADVSKYLRLKVTATNSVGSVAAYSVNSSQVDQTPINNTVPSITGTAQVGSALTSSSGSWDGYPAVTYAYQWQTSADGSSGWSSSTGSGNATSSYTVAGADAGKYLRVRVTAANSAGSTAAYSAASSPASQSPANTAVPAITGSAQVGSALTSSSGSWDGYPAPTYAYQWQVSADGSSSWASATGSGNTTASYTAASADAGKYLRVRVTATNSVNSAIAYSANTASVVEAPSVISNPSISGSAVRGSTLTAADGSWNGTPTPTLSRVWYRCSAVHASSAASAAADCAVIASAAASTYVTVAADDNNYIAVKVTASNSAGSANRVSATTALIGTAPVISVEPSISGSAIRPTTLTASDGSADGVPTPTVASRAWYRCTTSSASATSSLPASCSLISGETASTYAPVDADNTNYIILAVTYSNSFSSLTRYSASTASVKVPSSCSTPTISGSFTTGGSTSASASCSGSPTPSVSYQWQVSADGSTSWSSATGVGNATASYTVASADAGKYLRVHVSASNTGGSTTADSAASSQITQAVANTALPAITGTARSGQSLSASSGTWDGFPTPTYAYQWQTSANGSTGWTSATGTGNATSSYTVAAGDAGNYLRVQVTATNSVNSAAAYSNNTASVTAAPVNTSLPSLSGTTIDGQTLTASSGSWTGTPAPTYAYQWQVSNDGSTGWASAAGTGNSTASYIIAASDVSKYLRVQVTATNSVSSVSANSSASAQVTASTVAPANTALPAISGTASTGQDLTASSGSWTGTPTPTYAYQWQTSADGTTGWAAATGTGNATSSYTVAAGDAGNYLRVQVTATNSVSASTASSAATSLVTSPPANTVLPVVTGTARSTQTLTASSGSWTGTPTPTYAYQWQTSANGSTGWTSATGTGNATSSYTVASGDAGNYLRVQVTASNSVSSVTAVSAATASITALPINTVLPAVTGTASSTQNLTASSGTWTGTPTPTYAYQWQVYQTNSAILGTTGTTPRGLAFDSAGNVYTANNGSNNVSKITPAGVSTILGTTGTNPQSLTIDSAGNIYTPNGSNNVSKITPAGVSTILGTTGTLPVAITVDSAGNIYTTNRSSKNVSKITPAGVSTILGTTGTNPYGITIDSAGNVYTAIFGSNTVSKITSAGVSTTSWASTGSGPIATAVDSAGNVYTANYSSNNVSKITPGGVSTILGTTGTNPYDIAVDSAGNVYTANYASNNVSKITPAGVSTILGTTGAIPASIGIDSSDNVYTANGAANVSKISWGWTSAGGTGNATASYTVASSDAGKYLRVQVTATNSAGSSTVSSAATASVTASPINTALPAVTGSASSTQTLTASSGTWTGTPTPTYAYQWQTSANGSSGWASAVGAGNATSSYTVAAGDAGNYLRVQVTATNSVSSVTASSSATASVTAAPINTALPAVSGSAQVDSSLSASSGSWTGTPTPTYAYQWQTSANGTTGWTSATGVGSATASYTVAAGDAGQYLRVQVSATNSVSSVTASSAASAAVTQAAACSTPSFSGTPGNGQVLLASASCTGTPTPTLTYQWQVSDDGSTSWTSATGAGNATASYTVAAGDAGKYVRVTVTGTNSSSSASASSAATQIYLIPANTSLPLISGTAQSGQTLNATSGSWTGYPAPTYAYQWQVSADGSTGWASATGTGNATASYVATSADAGKYLRVSVTASNSGGSTAAQSAASARLTGLPTNTAAPAVSGTAQAGQDLTATSGSWTGYPTPTYTYQWQVSADGSTSWTSATGTGATTTTYTAATADAGKYLRVQVTATNSVGSGAPAYSANSSLVAARPAPVNTALPAVSGSVQTGQILSATAGSWNHSPSSYAYQWQTSANGTTGWASSTGTGNATSSYTVASADAGNYLRVQVTATNESGSTAAQSAATTAVTALPVNTAVPAVSGSVVRGSALTASNGTWTGSPAPTYATAWYRCDTTHTAAASLAGDCSVIASATSSTYTTVSADDGKFIAAQITATNSSGSASYVSATTAAITYLSCTNPIVTGTARSGQTLSTTNTCSGTPTPSVSYQWQTSADGSTGWASATGSGNATSSYTVASGDAGKYLRVQIIGTNTAGSSTVYSVATASVTAAPINTVLPSVTGTASTGSALTAASGTWTGTPAPTYAYQWQVSTDGTTGWAAATGTGNATSSYTVASADAGQYLRVQVTATNSVSSVVATSSATSAVTALPVNTVAPAVSGTASSTQTLTASSGTWTGTPTPTYAYQWQTSANGTTGWTSATGVGNATSSYTVAAGDTGNYLRVQVTATNGAGSVTASSAATSAVTAAPINTALPAVSGTASSTQTLLASSGTWTGTPTPTYAYQWQTSANGTTGWTSATGAGNATSSYTVAAADAGNYLRVQVAAANTAGSVTASSAATSAVTAAPINTVLPSVTGTASTGSALTAASGTWTGTPTPTYAYQWQTSANGTTGWTSATGSGNTTSSYTVASADAGNYLRVQVTATNSVSSVAASSAATAAVTAGPANTAAPSVSGSVVRGQALTASNGTWTGSPAPTYATAWYRCDTTHTAAASLAGDCSVIASATSSTYSTVAADDGKFIAAQITASNSSGSASYVSATTAAITYLSCTTPVITGTVAAGQVISTTNTCSGTPTPSVSYQWQTSADGSTAWTSATGTGNATASYTVPAGDAGKFLRVQITGSNTAGSSTATSASIQFTQAPANTVLPVIAGTTTPGSVLTASSGTWTGAPTPTYAYQWMRCDLLGGQCTNIGTNSSTYTLVNADASYTIKVQVTASNVAGSAAASSAFTSAIASASGCTITTSGGYTIHTCTTTGSNTINTYRTLSTDYLVLAGGGGGGGTIAGGGGGGGMLEGSASLVAGNISTSVGGGGAGALGWNNSPAVGASGSNSTLSATGLTTVTALGGGGGGSYGCGVQTGGGLVGGSGGGGGSCANTTGAAGTASQGNAGGNGAGDSNAAGGGGGAGGAGVSATASAAGGGGAGRSSSITGAATLYGGGGGGGVRNGTAPGTVGAAGTGGGGLGNALDTTVAASNINGTNGLGGGGGGCGHNGGSANRCGGNGGSGLVIVRYLTPAAPANTAAPTIAGTANNSLVLSGAAGTWTGEPTPTLTYQWQVAAAATGATWSSATGSGATSLSYTVASADIGKYLRLTVTGTSTSGVATASSAASSVVTDKPINTVVPAVTGVANIGSTLTSDSGSWTGATPISYAYQWQVQQVSSTVLGTTGSGPTGLAVDSAGNIYTANYSSNNVSKITPAGVSTILGTTGVSPRGITIDSAGNIYTVNYGVNNVSKITPGGVSTTLGTTGSMPYGITIDSAGNIYTVNYADWTVSKITPAGVSTILGTTGRDPVAITIDSAGNIYTVNQYSSNVSKITPAGVSTTFGATGSYPSGITVDSAGNIYTANRYSNNVSKITPAGVSTTLGTTGSYPFGIKVDSAGNVYTSNTGANNVSKITPGGVSTIDFAATGTNPNAITLDAAGNAYTSNAGSDSVSKITPPTWVSASGAGATTAAYVPAASDAGKILRSQVTASNSYGSTVAYSADTSVNVAPVNTVVPLISFNTTPGSTLTATTGTWTGSPTPTLTYQWQRCDLNGLQCTNVGTNSSTYTLVNADAGQRLKAIVTASNVAGSASAQNYSQTIASASGCTVTTSGLYTIHTCTTTGSSTLNTYRTLSSDYLVVGGGGGGGGSRGGGGGAGGMQTGNGSLTGPYNYAITVGAGGTSANGSDSSLINTAAGWSVTGNGGGKGGGSLAAAGSTGGSGGGNGGNCCSYYLAGVAGTPGQGNAGGPTVSGDNPRCASGGGGAGGVGIGACSRADGGPGLASSITGASVTYAGGGGGAVAIICGEGYSTNTAGLGGAGGGGSGGACNASGSAGTNGLGGGGGAGGSSPGGSGVVIVRYLTPAVPANTAAPTIAGTFNSGSVVTGTAGTWTGEPTPTLTYQWQVSANGTTGWASATGSGATSLSYTVAAADASQYLRLTVTGTSTAGITAASSAASSIVTNVPVNSVVPTVTGTATVAGSLSAGTGTWTGTTPTSYSYQWQVSANGTTGWTSATGTGNATASYVPAGIDAGQFLRVSVIANSAAGSSAAAYSAATASVTYFPINTVAPVVSGSTLSGQTLAATSGTWTGTPTPTYTYQWQVSSDGSTGWASATGVGNTSATYTPAAADASKYLRVAVTGANAAGSVIAYSNSLGPVQFAVPTLAWSSTPATPVVTGTTTAAGTWTLGGGAASSVECQTNSGSWGACASTTTNTWTLGAAGSDTVLNVRATNLAGTSATLTRTVHRNYAAPTVSISSAPPPYYYQTGTYNYTTTGTGSCSWVLNDAPWSGSISAAGSCTAAGGSIAISAAQRGGQGWRRMTITVTNADGSTSASTTNDWYSGASDVPNGDFQTSALAPYWGDVTGSYGGFGGPGIFNYNTWLLVITNNNVNGWSAAQQTSGQYNRCDNIYWESSVNTYTQANYTYVGSSYSAPSYTAATSYTAASYYAGYYTAAYSYVSSYSYPQSGKAGFRLWYWDNNTWNLYYDLLNYEGSTSMTSHAAGGNSYCGVNRLITLLGSNTTNAVSGGSYFDNVRGQNAG